MSATSQQQLPLEIYTNENTTTANSTNDHSKPLSKSNDSDSAATVQLNTFKDQQSNHLPHKKLMQVFPLLALAQFTAYLDQTSISAAVPTIGEALHLGPQLSWVATSYLMATTAVQLLNGRLSDIFGRKQLLLMSLGILATGNLVCGFSNTPAMLFTFRVVAGLGGGAITALVQIIASDVTTLQQRGKYNGFIGLAVAFGSGLGPLLGGTMATKVSWRWTLWYDVPWLVVLSIMLFIVLPSSKMAAGTRARLGMIDWIGVAMSVAATVLLLVPLSQGGSAFAWNSSLVISMLVIGVITFTVFLAVEWKVAKLPIMPLHLFQNGLSCNILLVQNVLFGIVFWGNLYYMPIYLVNVRGYTAIMSGAIIMPMAGSQGLGSILSGLIISHTKRYNPVMVAGQWVWALLLIPQAFYSRTTPIWAICIVGFFQGLGTGCCFQPSLVALLAHSRRADRAVLNSLRNFLRSIGGTLGLTLASLILNNVLKARLKGVLDSLGLSAAQRSAVLDAYMASVRTVFIVYAPLIGACALAALFVKDNGLEEKDTSVTLSPNTPAPRR
ncbi:similar to MFS multidrug transporter [Botrytis cinerea T4]|uniref:Similar to MFS multidrug transporter n=1 Tax=Botryotinia fuckeliana (strain T4) TaxID=999810 RepID=G2YXW4_BOTF4|nr:similar to MFS multidrug transporter [Botrytis cinerea T4]